MVLDSPATRVHEMRREHLQPHQHAVFVLFGVDAADNQRFQRIRPLSWGGSELASSLIWLSLKPTEHCDFSVTSLEIKTACGYKDWPSFLQTPGDS